MFEGGTMTVGTVVKQVSAPLWVSNMYGDLVREIRHIGEAITVMINEKKDPREMASDLVRAYEIALSDQHTLYALEAEARRQYPVRSGTQDEHGVYSAHDRTANTGDG